MAAVAWNRYSYFSRKLFLQNLWKGRSSKVIIASIIVAPAGLAVAYNTAYSCRYIPLSTVVIGMVVDRVSQVVVVHSGRGCYAKADLEETDRSRLIRCHLLLGERSADAGNCAPVVPTEAARELVDFAQRRRVPTVRFVTQGILHSTFSL